MMQNRFISGIIAGGMLGATTSMFLNSRMNGRSKKRLMKRSRNIMRGISSFMNIFS